jgi:poly-beta-1,6-N-acetyl-D-glucosamine N-deacetylase
VSARADQPRRSRRRRAVSAILVLTQVIMFASALSLPLSFAWLRQRAVELGLQELVSSSATVPVSGLVSVRPALVVLAYHNVQKKPTSPMSVTPLQFRNEMRMIRNAGYTSASRQDVLAALAGRPITGHKVLITFDDGPKGLWTYADPILAKYGMRATAFLITGVIDNHQPFYLTWREVQAMHSSGRWDLESHTNLGHWRIPINAAGLREPFMSNLEWLPASKRLETMAEYSTRVSTDLTRSKAAFTAHGLPAPVFFAYPFSASGHYSNDPRIEGVLHAIVSDQFVGAFTNNYVAGALTPVNLHDKLMPRIEVKGATTPLDLLARMHRSTPRTVAEANLLLATDWCCSSFNPNVTVDDHGALRVSGTKASRWWHSTYGPNGGEGWTSYMLSARVHGLTSPDAAAELIVGSQGRAGLRVIVQRGSLRVVASNAKAADRELAWQPLPWASSHQVTVWVDPPGTQISVDGSPPLWVSPSAGPNAGGVGVGIYNTPTSRDLWFDSVQLFGASHHLAGALTPANLVDRLKPRTVAQANLLLATEWRSASFTPNVTVDNHGALRVSGIQANRWWESTYGPSGGKAWTSYMLSARVHGLTSHDAAAELIVGSQGRAGLRVIVQRGSLRVVASNAKATDRELAWQPLPWASSHQVTIRVGPTGTQISVDGSLPLWVSPSTGPNAGGVGVGIQNTPTSRDLWLDSIHLYA